MKKAVKMRILVLFLLAFFTTAQSQEVNKNQIAYLMQAGEVEKSIALYFRYKKELDKHDFEILQHMAFILLDNGAKSTDSETQLLSIYGSGIAGAAYSLDILESGLKSTHPETQVAAIQFLGGMQDDRSDELLVKAMSSQFLFARMEAALHLAQRKHKTSVGQIESLMYRIPPQARFLFPQFFALIGNSDAISILRHLMEDKVPSVRVEALLSAARFGRDDLLPAIRMNITHINIAEQEAAAYAVGLLRDSKSVRKLKHLSESSPVNVRLAAARSLHALGDKEAKYFLIEQAKQGDLFAIVSLADIPEGRDTLAELCNHSDMAVHLNAGITLLKHRDPRCRKVVLQLLLGGLSDTGFSPHMSIGKTMLAFKPVYSTSHQKNTVFDVRAATLAVRQEILMECMHLPEGEFVSLAEWLFNSSQTDLIPTLVALLENLQTIEAIDLLKRKSQQAGMPLIRTYCTLALYRMGQVGNYESDLMTYIDRNKNSEMIRFRPIVPIDQRFGDTPHELTPEDSSRLLIEAFSALSEKQKESSVNILLDALQNGNPKNRCVLAGLLLRTLQ